MDSTVVSAMKGEELKDPPRLRNWFARIKIYARQKKVWELVNPQIEEEYLEEPIRKPRRRQYPEAQRISKTRMERPSGYTEYTNLTMPDGSSRVRH
jgi:hypothetical protein